MGARSIQECGKAITELNGKYGENKVVYQPCDVKKKEDMESRY